MNQFALTARRQGAIALLLLLTLGITAPAWAHHPTGSQTPATVWTGLLSGLAHPVIGLDHLAFVVAVGMAAALAVRGWAILPLFLLTALGGTSLYIAGVTLPAPELWIAASVLAIGLLLAWRSRLSLATVGLLAAAGWVHGYAYGEAIVGAEMTPLVAYLAGFTIVQSAIALFVYRLIRSLNSTGETQRYAGFAIAGAGMAFLSMLIPG